jgi:lipoate-protein ligase B
MAELVYLDLGGAGYEPTLQLQRRLAKQVREAAEEQAYLVLVEHDPPVITLGRRGREEDIVGSPDELRAEGIEVHKTSRGGEVTYHGPGQLVGYPILRLDLYGRDVRGYLRDLEGVLIRVLERFGIEGSREEGLTGVWVGGEKIAAIGVAVRRWVTYHGVALNVSPDLSHFDLIVPCGAAGKKVTSLSRALGRDVSVSEVKPVLIECMVEKYGFQSARAAPPESIDALLKPSR